MDDLTINPTEWQWRDDERYGTTIERVRPVYMHASGRRALVRIDAARLVRPLTRIGIASLRRDGTWGPLTQWGIPEAERLSDALAELLDTIDEERAAARAAHDREPPPARPKHRTVNARAELDAARQRRLVMPEREGRGGRGDR